MTPEEKQVVSRALIGLGIGLGVLGALTAVGVRFLPRYRVAVAPSGDTPVVLVGGSLTFKAGDKSYAWVEDTPNAKYHISPAYPIVSVALKTTAGGDPSDAPVADDSDATTDLIRTQLTASTQWKIDEYVIVAPSTTAVVAASLTQQGSSIYLTLPPKATGWLCPNKTLKKIIYSPTQSCPATTPTPDPVSFSNVGLTVTDTVNGVVQTEETGNLNCLDTNSVSGECRIVFRGH
jgi:hypothetical protein